MKSVMMNPLRTGLLITLKEMGADIVELDRREEGAKRLLTCARGTRR